MKNLWRRIRSEYEGYGFAEIGTFAILVWIFFWGMAVETEGIGGLIAIGNVMIAVAIFGLFVLYGLHEEQINNFWHKISRRFKERK